MSNDTQTDTLPPMRERVRTYIISLQEEIVSTLEKLDPNAPSFKRDSWLRPQGGEGISCVFAVPSNSEQVNTTVLEKAGVNISVVHGKLPPAAIRQMRADHSSIPYDPASQQTLPFFAAGISIVIHPRNPNAPTIHMNYRYFEISEVKLETGPEGSAAILAEPGADADGEEKKPLVKVKKEEETPKVIAWWFGGGSDLTPSYFFEEDARHFHGTLKKACDEHGSDLFPAFKKMVRRVLLHSAPPRKPGHRRNLLRRPNRRTARPSPRGISESPLLSRRHIQVHQNGRKRVLAVVHTHIGTSVIRALERA